MLYFAYGHNTNDAEMRKRLPHARKVGTGWLRGYRLVLYKYATIEPAAGGMAGVVWELTPRELQVLDQYEEVPDVYRRKYVMVEMAGKRKRAIAYVMTSPQAGAPSSQYLRWLHKGYTRNRLFTKRTPLSFR